MTDVNVCYLIGCTNEAPHRCSRCRHVHYCCVEHQRQDWTAGGHNKSCRRYQLITSLAKEGKMTPDGFLALTELREGRIPWYVCLEDPEKTRVVAKGILDAGYMYTSKERRGQRLTMEIYDQELSPETRQEIVKVYFHQWYRDVAMNNPAQLDRAMAKTPNVCHKCGAGTTGPQHCGLMPDPDWIYTKSLCSTCSAGADFSGLARVVNAFEWQPTSVENPVFPDEWIG